MSKPNEEVGDATWLSSSWTSLLDSYQQDSDKNSAQQSTINQAAKKKASTPRVRRLEVSLGQIDAQLSASKTKSYQLEIVLPTLNDETWEQIIETLSSQALYAAQMLAGNLPAEIQTIFAEANCTLLPHSLDSWSQASTITVEEKASKKSSKNAEQNAVPLERMATDDEQAESLSAVYTMLGELFEEDPWMLLELHGRTRSQILQALRENRVNAESTPPTVNGHDGATVASPENEYVSAFYTPRGQDETESPRSINEQGLEEQLDSFWGAPKRLKNIHHRIESPEIDLVLLRRLGPPPFNQDSIQIYERFTALYRQVGDKAIALAYSAEEE